VNYALASNGFTTLMCACQYGHLDIVRELCARGTKVNAARTDNGGTALHTASHYGHLDIVRLLLQKGADKTTTANDGITTPFSLATGPHKAALQALLKP